MASIIQLKTGKGTATPTSLTQGEVAINVDKGLFYFGSGSGEDVRFLDSFRHITASGNISSSGNIIGANIFLPGAGKISFDNSQDGSDQFISGNDNNITIDGDDIIKLKADTSIQIIDTSNAVQVSINPIAGHITASGNVKAAQLRVDEVDELPTAITGGLVYSASAFYMGL